MSESRSKLSQMVEEEATRAEAEEPTPEPTPESNPPAEEDGPKEEPEEVQEESEQPEQPAGLSADQGAELEKATTAYFKRVTKVFGAGNEPPECPTCNGLGFDLTGGAGAPEFQEHEQYKTCPECAGLGQVLTGSKVLGHDLHDCPRCMARGYLEKLPAPTATTNGPQAEYGTPTWMGDVQPNVTGYPG